MSEYAFIDPAASFSLPPTFDWNQYIYTERELWALFPETDGLRVNFVQIGLSAQLYAETLDDFGELQADEAYILMPYEDLTMRPMRMRAVRRLTLSDFRMGYMTAAKLIGIMSQASELSARVGEQILGAEVLDEIETRLDEISGGGQGLR